ncbi:acid phosphatase [Favolaschia claudopus]|uniref:Acid phosphatase n=1 Tax=Favolaschia claudopus TaxID=2862362 RepID=A0AAW0D6Y9_9AGAR
MKAGLALTASALCLRPVYAATTVIPTSSFSSISAFESFWAYLYPWGSDHNGSARMVGSSTDHSHIVVASNTLSLIATPTSGANPPTSTANPNPAIHYASGAIHAKSQITVTSANSYTLSGEFSAPTVKGTWPAFCTSWPPETDIGEWKGTNNNWYNTFNTSSIVKSTLVAWPADLSFHSLKAVLTAESNNADVKIDFYMDNVLKVTQFGKGFVNQPLWLIINLQANGGQFRISGFRQTPNKNYFLSFAASLMQVFGASQIDVLAFILILLHPSVVFAQNSSTQHLTGFSPTPAVFADLEDMPQVLRSAKPPPAATHDETKPYTYRPPQAPLDVKGYPVAPADLQLEQVHIYVRHGERTPVGVRLAPFIPEHWIMCKTGRQYRNPVTGDAPGLPGSLRSRRVVERKDGTWTEGLCLLGELTDVGRKSTFNYGTALRSLYIDKLKFLPDFLQPSGVYFRSTNMPRTIESLEQVIHGLYPTSKCDPDVQPTVLVRNGKDENLLGNTMSCKRLEYLQIGFAQAACAAYNPTLEPLDAKISKYLDGRPIRIDGKPRASGVLDTVRAAIAHGIKVPPEFEDKSIVDVIEQAVVAEWFADKTQEVRKLGMGPLLSDLSQKMANKAEHGAEDALKILVHSTHDTALAAMLSTLDVFDEKWPAFASHVSFELFKKSQPDDQRSYLQAVLSPFKASASPEYFVRMRYQNRNMALPVCAEEGKHLPGSPEFCTLSAFRERVKELTPVDWDTECVSTGWS